MCKKRFIGKSQNSCKIKVKCLLLFNLKVPIEVKFILTWTTLNESLVFAKFRRHHRYLKIYLDIYGRHSNFCHFSFD